MYLGLGWADLFKSLLRLKEVCRQIFLSCIKFDNDNMDQTHSELVLTALDDANLPKFNFKEDCNSNFTLNHCASSKKVELTLDTMYISQKVK